MRPAPLPETDRPDAVDAPATLPPDHVAAIVEVLSKKAPGLWRTQRSSVRHAILCRALIWRRDDECCGAPIRAQLVDLSRGGVGLLIGRPVEIREHLVLETTLENVGPIQWRCRVCWCEPTDDGIHRIGAQFVDVNPSAG